MLFAQRPSKRTVVELSHGGRVANYLRHIDESWRETGKTMAKSKSPSVGLIILVGTIALIASVPKEVWVGAAVVGVIAIAAYRYRSSNKPQPFTITESSTGVGVRSSESKAPTSRDEPVKSKSPSAEAEKSASTLGSSYTIGSGFPSSIVSAPKASVLPAPATSPSVAAPDKVRSNRSAVNSTGSAFRPSVPNTPKSNDVVASQKARLAPEAPVSTGEIDIVPPTFRLPTAPMGLGKTTWIPSAQSVDVAGIRIPGGMIYVGTKLPTPLGSNDPCLIDPSKSVARRGDYTERQMGYWPSYSDISSEARRSYLNWLAGDRRDPEADIGFVFLFFYGLERRAIIDGAKEEAARSDWPGIAAELRRLLAIYGPKSGSFRMYASSLLDWVTIGEHPAKLYESPIPSFPKTVELPLYLRLALGQAAVDSAPLPVHVALAWARLEPNIDLRTPAKRCADEFEQLFAAKYTEAFGAGMVIPRNRTKLKFVYRAASSGFHGHGEIKLTFRDTPDVTALTAPTKKLQLVVEAATLPLESFSRAIAKNSDARSSLDALLQLPESLWPVSARKSLQALKTRIGNGVIEMPFQELLNALGAKSAFNRDKTVSLALALQAANVGFEPDILADARAPKAEETVVLFSLPLPEQQSRANGPYLAAALTLQLASAVAYADGEFSNREMGHLSETVLSWKHLNPGHTQRLLARLRLLAQAPVSLTTLKKKFEPLDQNMKETIAAFMATVAQSDGEVSPAEVKMLQKVYKALGVDSTKVFADLHAVAIGTKATAVTTANVEESGLKLDPARIAALQKDTEKVSMLLANIFTEAEEPAPLLVVTPADVETEDESTHAPTGLLGLDEAHSAFARLLLSRPEWSREELFDVAADLELMLDGALEHISEAAFDAHDLPFFEGEDPVTINSEILEKLEA